MTDVSALSSLSMSLPLAQVSQTAWLGAPEDAGLSYGFSYIGLSKQSDAIHELDAGACCSTDLLLTLDMNEGTLTLIGGQARTTPFRNEENLQEGTWYPAVGGNASKVCIEVLGPEQAEVLYLWHKQNPKAVSLPSWERAQEQLR